jgi:hypothetical protein
MRDAIDIHTNPALTGPDVLDLAATRGTGSDRQAFKDCALVAVRAR